MRILRNRRLVLSDSDSDSEMQEAAVAVEESVITATAAATAEIDVREQEERVATANAAVDIEILDDEDDVQFMDAQEYTSPQLQPQAGSEPQPEPQPQQQTDYFGDVEVEAIAEYLKNIGVRPRREWINGCVSILRSSNAGFAAMNVAHRAELCMSEFLFADLNTAGDAVLPAGVDSLHAVQLPGPFVLQVDEIVNIALPLKERYKEVSSSNKRCLKLSMTDGVQRVFGIEYRPIKDLMVLSPAGFKIALRNVHIRRGLFLLVPEVINILGGFVEHLAAAHERVVNEVNKPPRGKRNRSGEEPLSLVSKALVAAWPPSSSESIHDNGIRVEEAPATTQSSNRGVSFEHTLDGRNQNINEIHEVDETDYANIPLNVPDADLGSAPLEQEMIDLTDEDIERSFMQIEEIGAPFSYLAILKARKEIEPNVQGIIKGILTGVKEFQFKGRDTYELIVYVDDGSLIAEVLIDHKVVQKIIGHTPTEVTALLASNNKDCVAAIKENLKRFQEFLKNFEGTMLVEINDQLPVPNVLEMNEGCQTNDVRNLLERVNRLAERYLES